MPETAERDGEPRLPPRLVFRIPRPSLIAAFGVAILAIPFASGWPFLWLVELFPLAGAYAVLRLRTIADKDRLTVRGLVRTERIGWDELRALRVAEKSWVRVVVAEDRVVALPAVRLRHVPVLSLMSRGRIADPTAEPIAEDQETPENAEPVAESTTAD